MINILYIQEEFTLYFKINSRDLLYANQPGFWWDVNSQNRLHCGVLLSVILELCHIDVRIATND